MSEKVKKLLNVFLKWPEKKKPVLFLLMKLIQWLEIEAMEKINQVEELKHSFWFKCKE